ncbi:Cadherin EGF LAG seven-pass G-type receptor 2 [Mactra antiquata]
MDWAVRIGVLYTLFYFLCFKFVVSVNIHVDVQKVDPLAETVIFNNSIGEDWSYSFSRDSRHNRVNHVMSLDASSGTLYVKSIKYICDEIVKSPLDLQIIGRSHYNGGLTNYSITSLTIHFHNLPCSVPYHRKSSLTSSVFSKYSLQTVIFSDKFYLWNGLSCIDANQTILNVKHIIPVSLYSSTCDVNVKNPNYALMRQDNSIVSTRIQCLSESEVSIPIELLPCKKELQTNIYVLFTIHPNNNDLPRLENSVQHSDQIRLKRQKRNTAPTFDREVYSAAISENQPAGQSVILMSATDPDTGDDGKLTYSMSVLGDTRSNDMFTINPISGKVTTTVPLDREELSVHRFLITATDNSAIFRRSATATLTINVLDENDHTPTFDRDVYKEEKPENLPVATTISSVRAIDKDDGQNKEVRYSIIDPVTPTTFKIDPILGTISTLKVLNREVQASYQLVVQAKDQAPFGEQRSSTTTIDITVLDENDNYPQFDKSSYALNVSENLDVSSRPVITQVSASDADEGRNQEITYSITSGNIDDTFFIDSTTGEVSVQKPLDYETNKEFNLKIKASDNGEVQMTNSTTMWIRINDLNDNTPYFQNSVYKGSVEEGSVIGTSVLTVRALDADDGQNSVLEYALIGVPLAFPFAIDQDMGKVTVRATLDREIQSSYQFIVQVNDKGQPPLSATVTVDITVNDINDNSPIFSPKTYNVSISEKAPVYKQVIQVTANDADTGLNAKLTYQIVSGNNDLVFSIERDTGIITLAKQLDYKVQKKYILTVRASDSGLDNRFDTAEVHVSVTDTNKFNPAFENAPYWLNVDENAEIGTSVGKVIALDDDIGENGRITYELLNDIQEFKIDANTGEITTHEVLDREYVTAYNFDVRASDHGDPVLQDTAVVYVKINDKNDNTPKFDKLVYEASVSENAFDGVSVIKVHADDDDSGKNSQVKYSFSEPGSANGDFDIDEANGNIRVATGSSLDREKRSNYTLTVLATDSGFMQLTGSATVIIQIEDENDNPPKFPKDEIEVLVPENQKIGTTVAVIEAYDPDEGVNAAIEYSFEGGLDADKFILNSQLGDPAIIVNNVELDYESDNKEYYIRLKASSGPLISSALIIIKVQDVNDNKPVLEDFTIIFNNYIDHFPSEPIGRIPAFDPDVSDQAKLQYSFLLGNEAGFLILNETTGEIKLDSRLNSDVPRNGTIQVKVSDGGSEVTATCHLHVRLVTMEMLHNSVTIRINNITSDAFLSPLFTFFVDALATIINVPKGNIFVINVRNDTDVNAQILNVTVSVREKSVRVDRHMIDVFYSPEFLKEQIYLQRMLLANLSTLQILPFDDNLCLHEICFGFERCLSKLKFGEAAPFISSSTMMFRSIHPDNGYKCDCPKGFVGSNNFNFCDVEVNLCYSNPCNDSGTCYSKEGGYTCKCKEGFAGEKCEIDLKRHYETSACPPDVCQPPSQCVPLIEGGFRCDHCPNTDDYNQFCQLTARSFPRGSFLMYPTLKTRYRFKIQFQFATQERDGLLFYNGRFNELHDFIALEIIDSQVQFSFSTGAEIVKVSPYIEGGVNDGHWRQVTVDYLNMTATVTVGEDCDTEIAVKFGQPINYTCAARESLHPSTGCAMEGNINNCHKLLDLTGPLQIGGLPTLPSNFQVKNKDYIGCMKDFYIDEKILDFNKFVANNGTRPGCSAKRTHCASAPCQHGGTCREGWGTYLCSCPDSWDGKDCGQSTDPPRKLNGDGYLHYDNSKEIISPVNFPWYNGIAFRTRKKNGSLMFIYTKSNELVHIQLVDGFITYTYSSNSLSSQTFTFDPIAVNDGQWHYFEARWLDNGGLQMILDYGERQIVTGIQSTLETLEIQGVYVGALKIGQANAQNHFTGCVKHIKVGNTQTSVLLQPQVVNAQSGCTSIKSCDSSPCTSRAECIDDWETYTCKCPPGTLGPQCDSICTTYNPCKNVANCRHPQGGSYECECGQQQSGQYCEVTKQPCLKNWWGEPVCGPCPEHCTWKNGFDPSCNKKTGECSCRDNYYQPAGSSSCLPCNCYMHGSKSAQCDKNTGLCPCVDGVMGRRCDQCPSKYAEIRLDEENNEYGCRVNYEACPRIYSHGMWWDAKMSDSLVIQDCPNDAVGEAKRNCSASGLWEEPDFFNCTNTIFLDHLTQLEKMESGSLQINTFVAKTNIASLANSTSRTGTMYGNDVNITLRIMGKILQYETEQDGLNLTNEQDSSFLFNLLSVLSDILQSKYSKEWMKLNQHGTGAEDILSKMETYLTKLLSSLEITTTASSRPYNVVTDNIVLSVDFINKSNFTGRKIPKFDNIVKSPMFDEDTNINLPADMLTSPALKDFLRPDLLSAPKGYVGYIMYRDIGDLLPKKYDNNVRNVADRPMSINSPVFTVKVKDEGKVVTGPLSDPVVITFKQSRSRNRTSPQCVSWQYDRNGHGKWSTLGCSVSGRYTIDDDMFVKCTCDWNNMTNYALLMDISNVEYEPSSPVMLKATMYVGLIVGMSCMLFCFIIMFILKRVQCNANSIHINIMFVFFIALLAFIIGIDKTFDELYCRLVAIALHYFFMAGFSWLFVDVLHAYRMMVEVRNIDQGSMKFYYLIAYVIPGIIVSLAVGLNAEGYGNENFCWLKMADKFIWSFAGPVAVSVIINIFVFVLAMKASCREKVGVSDIAPIRICLFANIIILMLWGIIWVVGLLAVNYNYEVLHVMFAFLCLALGVFVCIMYIVLNAKVRYELKKLWYRIRGQKLDLDENIAGTRSSVYSRSALAYRNDTCDSGLARINVGISTTSTTSRSTSKSSGGLYKGDDYLRSTSTSSGNTIPVKYSNTVNLQGPYGYDPDKTDGLDPDSMQLHTKRDVGNDSDSDSEMSERVSLDLASSHSSDDDDDIDVQLNWENQLPKNKKIEEAKEQMRKKKEEFLQQQQQQQQQQQLPPEPSPMLPSAQHQYHNPFDHHIYSGTPSPKFSPKPMHTPGHWPGDPQLSGYTGGSDSEYRSSDQPTLSSTQPDVTLQTPEYKGREFKVATPRRTDNVLNDSYNSNGPMHSPLGSPHMMRTPQEPPRSPVHKLNSPVRSPIGSPRDHSTVKVLTHRGSVSSDSELIV